MHATLTRPETTAVTGYAEDYFEFEAPAELTDALRHLAAVLEHNDLTGPNLATSMVGHFENTTFSMHGGDDRFDGPQFAYGDLKVAWFKWVGRDMGLSRPVQAAEIPAILQACLASLGPNIDLLPTS